MSNNLKGRSIKGYDLQQLIGSGGFGAVYQAHQSIVDREVAIKVILPEHANDPHFIRNFEAEAHLIARLEHPYIVPLYDFWRDSDGAFLVMRYYPAGNLSQVLHSKGAIDIEIISRMIEQIASALDAAHANQIIHRDIKPANILLDSLGNAYLSDFGLAEDITKTDANDMVGSPAYIPPEIIQAEAPSPQSDLYSLGFVLYEMLTGQYAFSEITPDSSIMSVLDFHLNRPIPDILTLSDDVNFVIQRATAKDPTDRYTSAMDMVRAFREALHGENTSAQIASVASEYIVNPFKGLRAFDEADEFTFFGRDKLVKRLINRLDEDQPNSNFLALVGPSGSGKSSVVHAGLVPALRRGDLDGSDEWFILDMVPGINPFTQLVASLRSIALDPLIGAERELLASSDALQHLLPKVVPTSNDSLLLVIDQFEELFTQTKDIDIRRKFLDLLYTTLQTDNFYLVIMLRADFYDRPMLHEGFGTLIQERTQVILPLTSMELNNVITKPAEFAGLKIDQSLTSAIIADVHADAVALPLLQYALTEVFERREEDRLTLDGYEAIGGIAGALAYRADEIFNSLNPELQDIARQVFLRFVTLGEGTEDTRRRAFQSELLAVVSDKPKLQAVLDAFGQARLLTFDNDEQTREPTVEVAHEALIREWHRLRDWLDISRDDIRRQRILASTVKQWRNADKDPSYLLRGTQLTGIEEWRDQSSIALTEPEQAFVNASVEAKRELDRIEAERQAHEQELELRSRTRLRQLIMLFGVAAVLGIGLSIFALNQANTARSAQADAEQSQRIAERSQLEAESIALASSALSEYADGEGQLALALALDAVDMDNPPEEAYDALLEISRAPGEIYEIFISDFPVSHFKISPDGNTALFTGGMNPNAYLNVGGGAPPPQGRPPQGGGQQGAPPAIPDEFSILQKINLSTRQVELTAMDVDGNATDFIFLPRKDGTLFVVTASDTGQIAFWDYETHALVHEMRIGAGYIVLSATDDGQTLLVSSSGTDDLAGALYLVDVDAYEVTTSYPVEDRFGLARMTTDGNYIVGLYVDSRVTTIDAETGAEVMSTTFDQRIRGSAVHFLIHPNNQSIIINAEELTLPHLDLLTGDSLGSVRVFTAGTHQFALNADGTVLTAISRDGLVTIWDLGSQFFLGSFTDVDTMPISITYNDNNEVAYVTTNQGELRAYSIFGDPTDLLGTLGTVASAGGVWINDTEVVMAHSRTGAKLVKVNIETGTETDLMPLANGLYKISLSPDNRYVLAQKRTFGTQIGQQIFLYDLAQNRPIPCDMCDRSQSPNIQIHAQFVATSPNQILLADGRTVQLIALDDQSVIWERTNLEHPVTAIDSSHDGTMLAIGMIEGGMLIADRETGEDLYTYQTEDMDNAVELVEFSPDGQSLAVVDRGSDEVIIVDLEQGQEQGELSGHDGEVLSVTFFNDGQRVLTSSDDNRVLLWDLETGIPEEFDHDIVVYDTALSPDEKSFVSFQEDLLAQLWSIEELSLTDVVQWAQDNRVTRPLTESECIRYALSADCEETHEEDDDDDD